MIYVLICNFMPQIAGEICDEACTFRQLFAVNMFAITLVAPLFLMNVTFLCIYTYKKSRISHQEFLETMNKMHLRMLVYQVFHSIVGFGLWFFLV
jgi:hypothetical protein